MTNPFKKRTVEFTFTAIGLGRVFRVTTADGKKYYTNRRDYIHVGYEWNAARYLSLETITASKLLECGIKDGMKVRELDNPIHVQPIKVEQVHTQEIDLVKTWSDTHRPIWRDSIKFYTEDAILIQETIK